MSITGSHNEDEPILDVFLTSLEKLHPMCKPCSAVPGVKNCASKLGPVFKEKRSRKSGSLFQTSQQCSRACSYCLKHPARACSDCLALTKLTCLGEPRYFYGGKLARLGGRPCHRKRVKQQAQRVDPSSRANFSLPD